MNEQDRAALILKIATRLMRRGEVRGWSDALRQAKEQLNQMAQNA